MGRVRADTGWMATAALVLAVVAAALVGRVREDAVAEPAPAYELVPMPEGIDTLGSLTVALDRLASCAAGCTAVTYFWSPRMPLSRAAIPHLVRAARSLGAEPILVGFEELERYAETGTLEGDARRPSTADATRVLADAFLAAGALTHAPSLVVHDGGRVLGTAILGYKSAEAYEAMIAERLAAPADPEAADPVPVGPTVASLVDGADAVREMAFRDYGAVGVPGAYFRWVPGRQALAYESARRVYLMDLSDGGHLVAPGSIDFIPTPDGRFFVTPLERNAGLAFYDADEVFAAAAEGRSGALRAVFVDGVMRDQYPSVGILAEGEGTIRYRILTSWFQGLLYRDYEVRFGEDGVPPTVSPLGDPVVPCAGMGLSTPIMSQDGLEVAAREEASGTTKIYRILPGGACEEVLALGMPTRKVAWHASGRRLAFSTPRVRTRPDGGGADPGIFLYDRDERRLTRIADSEGASQLAFPDFIGEDAIVFMVPGRTTSEPSFFRVVEPLP